jgi:hypothetical protein
VRVIMSCRSSHLGGFPAILELSRRQWLMKR